LWVVNRKRQARTSHNVIDIYQIWSMSMFFDRFLSSFFPISWKKRIEILLIAHIRQSM
jgi:hypothetical protein